MTINNLKHAKVIEMYQRGDDLEHIALECGYTRASSISEIAGKYGIPLRKDGEATKARKRQVLELYRQGLPEQEIAARVGLSRSGVWSIIKRADMVDKEPSNERVKAFSSSKSAIAAALNAAAARRHGVRA